MHAINMYWHQTCGLSCIQGRIKSDGDTVDDDEEITPEEQAALREICGFCKGGSDKNKYGDEEELLTGTDCGNSGELV